MALEAKSLTIVEDLFTTELSSQGVWKHFVIWWGQARKCTVR